MLKYDPIKLKHILINEIGYNDFVANFTVKRLVNLDDFWQETLDQWLEDRSISDNPSIEGVSIPYIMKKEDTDFIQALIRMSVYHEFPGRAKKYLNRRRSGKK